MSSPPPHLVVLEGGQEEEGHADFDALKRRADDAAVFLQANEFQFEPYWLPVITLTWEYTKQAWEAAGEPTNLDGTPNYNSKPMQQKFSRLLLMNHPSWEGWWMERRHDSLRSDCRAIGEHLAAVVEWYRTQPEERRPELNYPRIVWREFVRAKLRPTPEKRPTKHEEELHDLEQQHAETVAAKDAEIKDLRAVITDVQKMIQAVLALGSEKAKAVVEGVLARLHGGGDNDA
jgi:hypothetical protein